MYRRGSWSPDFVYDNNKRASELLVDKRETTSSGLGHCWKNVEPPSKGEEEDEGIGERPPANVGARGSAGSASLELPSRAFQVRKTAAAFKRSRHDTLPLRLSWDVIAWLECRCFSECMWDYCRSYHVLYAFYRSGGESVRPRFVSAWWVADKYLNWLCGIAQPKTTPSAECKFFKGYLPWCA
jgi:hypothetical protein